tara:strand:- start:4075 stop:5160 length:1086 start_codon:yes stop_codon:yes gene_type:complete
MKKNRVLVAMSGGVDSSVSLIKILEAGYEPIGVTMKLWESPQGVPATDSYCCSLESINNAKIICQKYNVPHYTLDFRTDFKKNVVDYLVKEYFKGNTPNPCINCNKHLRWGSLIDQAKTFEADFIATGHYAVIEKNKNYGYTINKGKDKNKDQSYVLWSIDKKLLNKTLFPLGNLTKKEVRKIAFEHDLITAEIPDSQELCFLPNSDYRQFLKDYAPNRSAKEKKGNFILDNGEIVGTHMGISNYTIGQRRKLGISGSEPSYVKKIDKKNNVIQVSKREKMFFENCIVKNINFLIDPKQWENDLITTYIRYNHSGVDSEIQFLDKKTIKIKFKSPQFAVTPGQSAVFYKDDLLLGGGIISK